MFGMCINKRAVAAVAAVGVGLLVLSPRLGASLAPLLIMAICPLSMLLMMRAMNGRRADDDTTAPSVGDGDQQRRELEEEVNRLKAELTLRREDRPA